MQKLVGLLDTLWRWVDETPPSAHTLRYGNPAYRTWFARMAEGAQQVGGLDCVEWRGCVAEGWETGPMVRESRGVVAGWHGM